MAKLAPIFIVFCFSVMGQALTPSTFLTTVDKQRLQRVFESALNLGDLKNTHYSILGYKLLGVNFPKESEACDLFKKTVAANGEKKEGKQPDLEAVFHASRGASLLQACKSLSPSATLKAFLDAALEKPAVTVEELYYTLLSMKHLNLKIDAKRFKAVLDAILKKDSSAPVEAYAFHIVPELNLQKAEMKSYFEDIADVVKQADEANKEHLFYEAGLFTTAFVVDGIFKLAEKYGQSPNVPEPALLKLTNYLLSRRHTYQLRAAATLTAALHTLAHNRFQVPLALSLSGAAAVSSSRPTVQLRASTVWGGGLPAPVGLVVESARHVGTGATHLNREALAAVAAKDAAGEGQLFRLDLMKAKSGRGFFELELSAAGAAGKGAGVGPLVGLKGRQLRLKVTSEVTFEDVSVEVRDDQSAQVKNTLIQHPSRAANVIEVDPQQKLTVRYRLQDAAAAPSQQQLQVSQAFLRFVHADTDQEIAFIAEFSSAGADAGVYRHTVDMTSAAKKFAYKSGLYHLQLLVGDPLLSKPHQWHLADARLALPDAPPVQVDTTMTGTPPSDRPSTQPLPEIEHLFRQPEKRASSSVALVFTGLCLAPLLLLLLLWLRIGINVSNLPFSLSSFGFHTGIGSIFALYGWYWHSLSMFTTLRYLCILGVVTFLFGNRLLHSIAAKRQKS